MKAVPDPCFVRCAIAALAGCLALVACSGDPLSPDPVRAVQRGKAEETSGGPGTGGADRQETASLAAQAASAATTGTAAAPSPTVDGSTTSSPPSAALQPEDDGSTEPRLLITGRVLLPDGAPADGTTVTVGRQVFTDGRFVGLAPAPSAQTVAGPDGTYRVVLPGDHTTLGGLLVRLQRKGSATVHHLLGAGGSPDAKRAGAEGAARAVTRDYVLEPAVAIRGRVTDGTAKSLTGATVYAFRWISSSDALRAFSAATVTSGADGTFVLDELTSGQHSLQAGADGRIPVERKVQAPVSDVMLTLTRGQASISGNVYSFGTREALPGTSVTVQWMKPVGDLTQPRWTRHAMANEVGEFHFEGLGPGQYQISASRGDWRLVPAGSVETSPYRIELEAAETTSGLELFLYPGHTVTGLVRDSQSSQPIEGVTVYTYWGERKQAVTGPDGRFRLPHVFEQEGRGVFLHAEKKGYRVGAKGDDLIRAIPVRLSMTELEPSIVFDMVPTVTVSGTVRTAEGAPVPGAEVTAYVSNDGGARNRPVKTDAQGAYELEVNPWSLVRVRVTAEGYPVAYSPSTVEVEDQAVTGVDIVLGPGANLTGRVVDPEGNPAEGARVMATTTIMVGRYGYGDSAGKVATSGPQGEFSITNVPAGEVHVYATKKGYASSGSERVAIKSGESRSGLELKLRKGYVIAGRVTDTEGKPLAGIAVRINPMRYYGGGRASVTDEEGRYRQEDLEEGIYRVEAVSSEYGSEEKENIEAGREDVDFVLSQDKSRDRERERRKSLGTFVGHVVDYQTGQPISDFSVTSRMGQLVEKDPRVPGRFTIPNFNKDFPVPLEIRAPGYIDLVTGNQAIGAMEKTYRLGPGGTVVGRVVTGGEGEPKPLSNVRVQLKGVVSESELANRPPEQVVRTEADGRFRLEKVSPGQNWIFFRGDGTLADLRRQAGVEHGQETDLGDIVMGGGARVVGRVVRGAEERPVEGARLVISESGTGAGSKEVVTDAQGAFEIDGLGAFGYNLRVPEYSLRASFALSSGQTKELVFRIGGTTVRGQVLRAGKGAQASVSMTQPDGASYNTVSGLDGSYEIKGVAPGSWTIEATVYGNLSSSRMEEEIVIGDEPEVVKDLIFPSGRLVGRVEDKEGNPVANARISAQPPRGSGVYDSFIPETVRSTSKADGSFVIEGVKPGTYGVSASKDGRLAMAHNVTVPNEGDSEPVVLVMGAGGGTIVSTALSMTNGAPIKEAWLILSNEAGRYDHGQTRGDDGVLKIENVPPGTYHVQVSSFGFQVSERTIEVKEGEETRIDDVLYEAGALRWGLQSKSGQELKNVPCRLVPDDPNSIEQVREGVSTDGMWVVRGLYPGSYTATATTPEGTITAKILIQAHEVTEITSMPE